jgi:hypothetical protein
MDVVEATAKIVGATVAFFPKEVAMLLNKNEVTTNAQTLDTKALIDATFYGFKSSPSFLKEFSDFVERNR